MQSDGEEEQPELFYVSSSKQNGATTLEHSLLVYKKFTIRLPHHYQHSHF